MGLSIWAGLRRGRFRGCRPAPVARPRPTAAACPRRSARCWGPRGAAESPPPNHRVCEIVGRRRIGAGSGRDRGGMEELLRRRWAGRRPAAAAVAVTEGRARLARFGPHRPPMAVDALQTFVERAGFRGTRDRAAKRDGVRIVGAPAHIPIPRPWPPPRPGATRGCASSRMASGLRGRVPAVGDFPPARWRRGPRAGRCTPRENAGCYWRDAMAADAAGHCPLSPEHLAATAGLRSPGGRVGASVGSRRAAWPSGPLPLAPEPLAPEARLPGPAVASRHP